MQVERERAVENVNVLVGLHASGASSARGPRGCLVVNMVAECLPRDGAMARRVRERTLQNRCSSRMITCEHVGGSHW